MCYSHYGNGVRNGAISIARWGLLSDCYKVNPIDQWRKILVIILGFVHTLGPDLHKSIRRFWTRNLASMSIQRPFALDRSTEAKFIDQTFGKIKKLPKWHFWTLTWNSKYFRPKAFFWNIMKMTIRKNIHNLSQGPPNQRFMQENVQKGPCQNAKIIFVLGFYESREHLEE